MKLCQDSWEAAVIACQEADGIVDKIIHLQIATFGVRPVGREDQYMSVNKIPLCLPSAEAAKAFMEKECRGEWEVFCWETGKAV